ncbi:probable serine/threonine-protein kinase clkA [Daktulosphaira vitifoliae]|uniref:probable serine/threonine-protein kinase clkA n=1 Tax=Daktulosphaira vitifoliae TaxID=58002 RepID=UPI0021A9CA0D|nr:probable serine/threonine-protein kinase clkA [Daktulosphaira vitifoliae]
MYGRWFKRNPCYVVKYILLVQLISRRTGAECSVDGHGMGMNYPTTTASGTWTKRGGISSYGWDSQHPIDPCSRCSNRPHPLPGSQYTTNPFNVYNPNDRISNIVSDNRNNIYNPDNRDGSYNVGNRVDAHHEDRYNSYNTDRHISSYIPSINQGNGYNTGMTSTDYGTNSHGNNYNMNNYGNNYNTNTLNRNPDYRGNGYDNLSPEWERRHGNKKNNYNQGVGYPVIVQQGASSQGGYGPNDRWDTKGGYPVKENSGYWHSQPPKDIGWDEDSKKVGVVAGWIGGTSPNKYENRKPINSINYQSHNKDDDYFNKGTGYENSDSKKPLLGWGGSGSYEVIKMNHGYKYVDRNSNVDYGIQSLGNNYGYGGQKFNNKPEYNSKPVNIDRPYDYGSRPSTTDGPHHNYEVHINNRPTYNTDKFNQNYDTSINNRPMYNVERPSQNYDLNSNYNRPSYNTRPTDWSTSRPLTFEVRPDWNSQKPYYSSSPSRPFQHWGENSYNMAPTGPGYERPIVDERPHYENFLNNRPDYGSQRPSVDKFSSYDYGRPQSMMNNRPGNDYDRPYTNDIYASQQMGSGYGKGYASNWDYYSNTRDTTNRWNDPQREYLQRRPDGEVIQSDSNPRPSESTPIHYNGHSGIGASTDNGFLYRTPSTVGSSTTPIPTTSS